MRQFPDRQVSNCRYHVIMKSWPSDSPKAISGQRHLRPRPEKASGCYPGVRRCRVRSCVHSSGGSGSERLRRFLSETDYTRASPGHGERPGTSQWCRIACMNALGLGNMNIECDRYVRSQRSVPMRFRQGLQRLPRQVEATSLKARWRRDSKPAPSPLVQLRSILSRIRGEQIATPCSRADKHSLDWILKPRCRLPHLGCRLSPI
jgi:hypothetical protein